MAHARYRLHDFQRDGIIACSFPPDIQRFYISNLPTDIHLVVIQHMNLIRKAKTGGSGAGQVAARDNPGKAIGKSPLPPESDLITETAGKTCYDNTIIKKS